MSSIKDVVECSEPGHLCVCVVWAFVKGGLTVTRQRWKKRDSGERDSARLAWMLRHDAPLQLLLLRLLQYSYFILQGCPLLFDYLAFVTNFS